jgi:citrate lyase subunit beta / citryl-CoA lyase
MVHAPMRARRSCLSVPGSSEKMLAKARYLPADEVIVDLEDSVAAPAKDSARTAVAKAIGAGGWQARTLAVRINATTSPWCYRDLIELAQGAGDGLKCIVVPKVERAADLAFVDTLLGMVEVEAGRREPIGLEALIETATGLRHVHDIAHASPRLEALIVGYADLAASLGRPPAAAAAGDGWDWVLETVLVASRAAGLQAIDGPWLDIHDMPGFERAAARGRARGYDGKWALHPTQIEPLNRLFAPTAEELATARAIVDALARAEAGEQRGAVMFEGSMIDEASRKLALQMVERGEAAGLAGRRPDDAG